MNTLSPPESLEFVAGDAAWEKYRELALTDLFWFASYVLGYGERVPIREHAHRAFCRFVERRTGHPALDTARYRKIMMPRETGKTTILTQSYVIQRLCGNPDLSILIANEKEQNAKDFLYAIKQQFESNKVLRALFPEVLPPDLNDTVWSASRIILNRKSARKEPSIFVIGVGGTVTGTHPDIIIVDDMISREAAENARAGSWQIMHGVSRWVNQLDMLLNKNYEHAEITFVGTRWYFDDVYDHLDKAFGYGEAPTVFNLRTKLPNGEIQIIPAQRLGDLAVFTRSGIENGRPAFPEIWSAERMAQSRIRDEVLFAANILNNPSDELTATFKVEWLQYYDWLDEQRIVYTDGAGAKKVLGIRDLDVLFFVDPGGFGVRQLEDRARAAIVVVGSDGTGSHNVLDVYAERDTFLACIQQIVAWVTRYQPRKLVIERVGQQAAFIQLVREHLTRAGLSVTIDEEPPGRMNKDIRILGLEPYFQRGEIRIGKGPNFHGFRTQYTQFPRTAQKDILDALAYLPRHLRRMPGSTFRSATQRQQFELAAYRTRRGLAV